MLNLGNICPWCKTQFKDNEKCPKCKGNGVFVSDPEDCLKDEELLASLRLKYSARPVL